MPRIEILGTAITATHGTLTPGVIINVDEKFARHLVNACQVAKYLDVIEPTDTKQPETPADKKTTRKTPKQAFDDAEQAAAQPSSVDDAMDTETSL